MERLFDYGVVTVELVIDEQVVDEVEEGQQELSRIVLLESLEFFKGFVDLGF